MFAKVIVDIAHAAVDRAFTYRIPEGLDVRPGHHVLLPFGQGDHVKEGFVLSVSEESDLDDGVIVKNVLACAEPYTVLLPEQIALAEWMQEAYHCLLVDGNFMVGKKFGSLCDDRISAGQSLGQKNTILGIWMAMTFLDPASGIIVGAYMLWQNVFNSLQLTYPKLR